MKQILFLLVSFLVLSCSNNPVPKPDNLLDEEVMVDILFDVAVLNAAQNVKPSVLREHNIENQTFIFNKYKIDSITYHQNQRYYASKVGKYKRMHKKVLERLEQVKSQTNDTFENKEKK